MSTRLGGSETSLMLIDSWIHWSLDWIIIV